MAKYPIKKENVKNPNNEIHIVGLINISEDMEKYVPNPKKKNVDTPIHTNDALLCQ
ncbi:hypothetical protein LBMAG33_2930 [Candidatus Levyibacteriota bacterium]|nr:hypothetical protein LBMAG33_2930 [Candidatus Levybacteria bacterium]